MNSLFQPSIGRDIRDMTTSINLNDVEQSIDNEIGTGRQWVNIQPENHVSMTTVLDKVLYQPESWISIGCTSLVIFILTSILLAYAQPNIVLNENTTQLDIKKVLFFSLLHSLLIGGVSFYFLRYR